MLSFPPFRLDDRSKRLWRNGSEVRLRRKSIAVLCYLARNPRRLVTRDELITAVWERAALSENVLRTQIHDLRQVLGQDSIETVFGLGYRFVLPVTENDE